MSTPIQSPYRSLKIVLGIFIGVVVLALLTIVVVVLRPPTEASPALNTGPGEDVIEGQGRVEFGSRSAQINGDPEELIRFSAPKVPAEVWEAAAGLSESWIITSPLEITTGDPLRNTVTLTRVYPVPVPEEAFATFAHFDPDLNVWLPVDSGLSEDRRTLTATVDHLSTWTDFISGPVTSVGDMASRWKEVAGETISAGIRGAGEVLPNLADLAFYTVSSVIDTTARAPVCNGEVPDWVHRVVVMEDALSNPLHWCAGSERTHADTLVVKVANNRGYPVQVSANTEPLQAGPDGVDRQWLVDFFRSADVYGNIANSVEQLTFAEGFPLAGGESATLTFARPETGGVGQIVVTAAPAEQAVVLGGIAVRQMLPSVANPFLGDDEFLFVAAQCGSRVGSIFVDSDEAVSALVDCLTNGTGKQALQYFLVGKKGMAQEAAKKLGTRLSFYFIFASVAWQLSTYYLDLNMPEASRTLSVYLKPQSDTAPQAGNDHEVLSGSTEIVRVSPVTRDGQDRAGWTRSQSLQTDQGACVPSPVALDSGIYRCGPNALAANACFYVKSDGRFYCPLSPFRQDYRVFDFLGGVSDMTYENTYPWGLELDDGRQCVARQGGAWGARADLYNGAYSCNSGDEFILVAPGESGSDAVDDSGDKWIVRMGEMGAPGDEFPAPRTVGVSVAYYADWED